MAGSGGPGGDVEHVLRIEADGTLTYNQQALAPDALADVLSALAQDASGPTLFVALSREWDEAQADAVDRAPVLWQLLQQVQAAGLTRVSIVGPPVQP